MASSLLTRLRGRSLKGCGLLVVLAWSSTGTTGPVLESGLPKVVSEQNFEALKTLSPFRRTLALSDSIILTGIARIDNNVVATLFDTATSQTHLVTEQANNKGWHLVGVRGDESDLNSLTAKIQVTGGEVVSIRYEKVPQTSRRPKPGSSSSSTRLSPEQLSDAKKSAINYKKGAPADGFRDAPPAAILQKLSKTTVQQRETLNREMMELRNRGVSAEKRQKIYSSKLDKVIKSSR